MIFQEPKTALSKRTITLSKSVINELKAPKLQQNIVKLQLDPLYEDHDLVIATQRGKPLGPTRFSREFRSLVKQAGVPQIKLHALRHTFATLSIEQGTDIKTVQNILGHHSASFTLDVYSQATDKMKQDATDRIDDLLAPNHSTQ